MLKDGYLWEEWFWQSQVSRSPFQYDISVYLLLKGATGTSFTQNIVSGVEAMFANLGHFSPLSIKVMWKSRGCMGHQCLLLA